MDIQPPKAVTTHMAAFESWMAPLFAKAPHLSSHVRDTLVGIAPWIALIAGVLGIFGVLSAFSAVSMMTSMPFAPVMMRGWYPALIISIIILALSAVLDLMAFQPLGQRRKKGWNLLFYGTTLSAVSSIVNLVSGSYGLSGLLGAVIGYWLLFEVRELYKA